MRVALVVIALFGAAVILYAGFWFTAAIRLRAKDRPASRWLMLRGAFALTASAAILSAVVDVASRRVLVGVAGALLVADGLVARAVARRAGDRRKA